MASNMSSFDITFNQLLVLCVAVCYGECGSKHPHSRIYDEVQLFFEITG